MKLFRYVKVLKKIKDDQFTLNNKLMTSFEDSRIYFAHPASYNDPLECTIPIEIDNFEEHKEEYNAYIKNFLFSKKEGIDTTSRREKRFLEALDFGIPLETSLAVCFAQRADNQLMWSHYADQHQGICFCYEFPDSKHELDENVCWSESISNLMKTHNLTYNVKPVIYTDNRLALKVIDSSLPVGRWTFENDYIVDNAIFTKPTCWSYEEEWRFVLRLPFGSEFAFPAGIDTSQYFMTVPKEWLKQITFGLRLESHYCEEIMNHLKDNGYSGIDFRKEKMVNGKFIITSEPYKSKNHNNLVEN